jgi:DNA-binding NarL/FixJ family response regulator
MEIRLPPVDRMQHRCGSGLVDEKSEKTKGEFMKILLVDDNALFLASAQRFLSNVDPVAGVSTARDGFEALEQVERQRPDLVLMDLNMPRMNGFEATQRIKALAPHTRVIVLSLHDAEEFRTAAQRAGAEDFVTKQEFAARLPSLLKLGADATTGLEPAPPDRSHAAGG